MGSGSRIFPSLKLEAGAEIVWRRPGSGWEELLARCGVAAAYYPMAHWPVETVWG